MLAVKGWREEETLELVRRNYAAKLWDMVQLPPLDSEPLLFPHRRWKAGFWIYIYVLLKCGALEVKSLGKMFPCVWERV